MNSKVFKKYKFPVTSTDPLLGFTEVKTRNIFFKALLTKQFPKPEFGHHSLGIAIVK